MYACTASEDKLVFLRRIENLVSNKIEVESLDSWTFILGQSPSRGARSPTLWNAVYSHFGLNTRMVPLDVSAENLQEALDVLSNDSRVLGGAIAMPFKQAIASLLVNRLEPSASLSTSVNCVFRDSTGLFRGANTDGEAALKVIYENCSAYLNAQFLVLGCGGAGSAVISSLLQVVDQRQVTVSNRSPSASAWLTALGVKNVPFNAFEHYLETTNILINTTSLGFNCESQSPMSLRSLSKLPTDAFVFDVVYQPSPTKLTKDALGLGLRAIDGKRMNLLQAVRSFQLVNVMLDTSHVEFLMGNQT